MTSLSPTKQKPFNKRIIGFDIETYNNNKNFLLASVYCEDYTQFYYCEDEFISDIKNNPIFKDSMLCATNLAFDFFGTFFSRDELKDFVLMSRGADLLSAVAYYEENTGGFTRIPKTKENAKLRKKLMFIDSLNFAHLSVEKMGKILNYPKLDKPSFLGLYPKNEEEWDEMKSYNLRDSEVTYKFMTFLVSTFQKLGATFKLTISSTSMSLFTNRFLDTIYYQPSEEQLLFQLSSLYGGRTEALKRGYIKDMFYYDFNSLYPSVMQSEIFPDINSIKESHENTTEFILKYEGVSEVSIHCPYMKFPLLPYRNEIGRVIFPIGDFRGVYTHIELREALNLGYTIKKVYKSQYFEKTCTPFKEFINVLYSERLKYQKENSPLEYVVKILMNSLFGKFSQKWLNRERLIHENNIEFEDLSEYKETERIGKFFRCVLSGGTPAHFCIPIWSSYITAYGRIKLHKYINKYSAIYCDTDSIITDKIIDTNTDLGNLKIEMFIDEGYLVRPKFYACKNKNKQPSDKDYIKIKGLGTKLMYNDFREFLKFPIIHYNKFAKFREALRRGFIPNEIIPTHKRFNLEDEKRLWSSIEFNPDILEDSEPLIIKCDTE